MTEYERFKEKHPILMAEAETVGDVQEAIAIAIGEHYNQDWEGFYQEMRLRHGVEMKPLMDGSNDEALTLKVLARIAHVMNCRVEVELVPERE